MNLDDKGWFQFASRCWRPFQQWGFAIAAVAYAFRPVFELSFNVQTFGALAAAGGVGFITRSLEKTAHNHSAKKYAHFDSPEGAAQ